MQYAAAIAIVCGVLLYMALRALFHLVSEHLTIVLLSLAVGVPVLLLAGRALMKGALLHVRVAWEPPAIEAGPRLPAPVRSSVVDETAGQPGSPFSAEFAREDEERSCDGPGCTEALGDMVWTAEAVTSGEDTEPVTETYSFCSRRCAEQFTGNLQPATVKD